jgi:hypothetical protein
MSAFFDYIQTFYVNSDAVNSAEEVLITSVELFFKGKPSTTSNISNLSAPGLSVWICEVTNDQPTPEKVLNNSVTIVQYERIHTSLNATTPTTVSFNAPVAVKSGRSYGIVIKYDDPAFEIWYNKQGDALVTTTGKSSTVSQGSQGRFVGTLFKATSATDNTSYSDRDLKFKVNIAKFDVTTGTFNLVNKDYEFFTLDSVSGTIRGGDIVYQDIASATGTISVSSSSSTITGSGTTFTNHSAGQKVLFGNGTTNNLIKIVSVTNATSMVVETVPSITGSSLTYKVPPTGRADYTNYTNSSNSILFLVDSDAANATFKFTPGTRVIGHNFGGSANLKSIYAYSADNITPRLAMKSWAHSNFQLTYKTVNETHNLVSTGTDVTNMYNNASQTNWDAYILSRSTEVDTTLGLTLYGARRKSVVMTVDVSAGTGSTTQSTFAVPRINADELDLSVYQNSINNNTEQTVNGIANFDTETAKNGIGASKYISRKITFAADKFAEDIVVYLTGYRPAGTELKLYAKLHNSIDKESFDDKAWSPLIIKDNTEKYSSEPADLIEYTYGLPQYPEVRESLSGSFTVQSTSSVILASADQTNAVAAGDLIKVYDPILPDNHEVFTVLSANTTAISVNKNITNVNIIGNMSVDKLKYKLTAWNNIANDNVARYVSNSLVEYDTFNSMQIKIVLLSDSTYVVPSVKQIQAIAVSA